jgi:excisionase family DNA binding protein
MIAAERYLKTQRVAEALGVSVSTVKRWVDSGMIRAVRTAGKHRLIPMSEAIRIAQEQGVKAANIEVLAGLSASHRSGIDDRVRDFLFDLLRENKAREAKALMQSVYLAGCGADVLADDLIHPVMKRVGHSWRVGSLDVFQEHQATNTVGNALRDLIDRVTGDLDRLKPVAIGAAPEGDPYVLSTLLADLLLREMGWEVHNLGANLPLRSLANATDLFRPKLIFLSINFLKEETSFVREYRSFFKTAAANNAAVIVGGRALSPALREQLDYASFGERMAHLAEFARCIADRTPPLLPPDKINLLDEKSSS